jgi:hypothetical protein
METIGVVTIDELRERLEAEGCNPRRYAIGTRGAATDAHCLTKRGDRWEVYYTERGQDDEPTFSSTDEAEACAFFLRFMLAERHDHMVAIFRDEAAAWALRLRLGGLGIASFHDRIPYGGPHDPRFRVFVSGKAIFAARRVLGDLPLSDDGD